jgi:hypothetical protein
MLAKRPLFTFPNVLDSAVIGTVWRKYDCLFMCPLSRHRSNRQDKI